MLHSMLNVVTAVAKLAVLAFAAAGNASALRGAIFCVTLSLDKVQGLHGRVIKA